MTGAALALSDRDRALTPHGYALPQSGPVPGLTKRIVELLGVDPGDVVIDLCSSEDPTSCAIPNEAQGRGSVAPVEALGERLARLVSASGVRTVQISEFAFGRYPTRRQKVLLRGGFASLSVRGRALLSSLFETLDPTARFLVVDSAPSQDAPLFADGLDRWKREHCTAKTIAHSIHEAGFATKLAVVECARQVPTPECLAWIASRAWPVLETFSDAELARGLGELRCRYGAQPMVTFTSSFELVLGTKLETAGRA